jgi:hypothetical protein
LGSVHDCLAHVVGYFLFHYFKFVELEVVDSEIFAFGAFEVDPCEEETVSVFVLVVEFIVFGDESLSVASQDILGDLLVVSLEVGDKVFEDVCLVGFEVHLEEHVMGNDHSEGHPVEGTLLYAWLEQVWMVAYLLEPHQNVHHASGLIRLLLAILMPDDLIIEIFLSSAHGTANDLLSLLGQLSLHIFFHSSQEERP